METNLQIVSPMKSFAIKGTKKTPTVNFDAEQGIFEISGRSIPEDSMEFYDPLIDWAQKYSKTPCVQTTINIKLEYLNSSSSRYMLDLFKSLESIYKSNNLIVVNWYYEKDDEDLLDAFEVYESMVEIPFKKIEIE
jgi:hypothetical protein